MERAPASDDRQDRIARALDVRSSRLAGMYRSALRMLRSMPEPDCEVARVSIICHCMRELTTNLPAVMTDGFVEKPDPSSSSLISQLPALLAKHPDLDLSLDQDLVPVPRKVARHFGMLVTARVQEDGRNGQNAAALITGGSSPTHPATKQWRDASRFFVGWAHLDQNHERRGRLPSDQEILAHMRVVEDVIEVRTAAFFDNLHAVSDLLAAANTASEEDL